MTGRRRVLWLPAVAFLLPGAAMAQSPDEEREAIRLSRLAQNAAIADGDFAEVASTWMDDVVVTAGLGFVITGADSYRRAFEVEGGLIYERLPEAIDVSSGWPLAFERGRWEGRDESGNVLISGRYSAQWVKNEGSWLIRSELFVALGCAGEACEWPVGTRPNRPGAEEAASLDDGSHAGGVDAPSTGAEAGVGPLRPIPWPFR